MSDHPPAIRPGADELINQFRWQVEQWELWRDDPTAAFDQMAERFYRETGLMAPGKSQPIEMSSVENEYERRRRWDEWRAEKDAVRRQQMRDVLSVLEAAESSRAALQQQIEALTKALQKSRATACDVESFLDSVEWTDRTSEDEGANAQVALQSLSVDIAALLASPAAPTEPDEDRNPCHKCGTPLWNDPRPCWNCQGKKRAEGALIVAADQYLQTAVVLKGGALEIDEVLALKSAFYAGAKFASPAAPTEK